MERFPALLETRFTTHDMTKGAGPDDLAPDVFRGKTDIGRFA